MINSCMIDHTPTIEQRLLSELSQIEKNLSVFPDLEVRESLKELRRTVEHFIEENTDDWK